MIGFRPRRDASRRRPRGSMFQVSRLDVGEDRRRPGVQDRVRGRDERVRRADDFVAGPGRRRRPARGAAPWCTTWSRRRGARRRAPRTLLERAPPSGPGAPEPLAQHLGDGARSRPRRTPDARTEFREWRFSPRAADRCSLPPGDERTQARPRAAPCAESQPVASVVDRARRARTRCYLARRGLAAAQRRLHDATAAFGPGRVRDVSTPVPMLKTRR